MNKLKTLFALGLLATGLSASPILYMVTQGVDPALNGNSASNCPTQAGNPCGSYLALLDAATGAITNYLPISNLEPNEEIFDIATNAAGEIYGISATRLYTINSSSAMATVVGLVTGGGILNPNSLAFSPTGVLYAAGAGGDLYTLDTGTGFATNIGTWSLTASAGGDVAFVGNRLFIADNGNRILELNPANASVINTSPVGLGAGIQTLKGLAQGEATGCGSGGPTCLYVVADFNGGGGIPNVNLIDISSGSGFGTVLGSSIAVAPIGNLGSPAYGLPAGLADSVPEPSTILLSIIGCALVGFGRRNRK